MARAKNRGYQQTFTPTYTIRRWRLGEYIRLSKEDLKKGKDDSNSVKNQRDLLGEFYNAEVERLKREGFFNPMMRKWTFENDNGKCPQMEKAHSYVVLWEQREPRTAFVGNVGSGKSYFACCIANALMQREIPVCMTNFATILNNLFYGAENRNEYIVRLCSYPLLILDDFGMERGTEYRLEQVYNVIDSRYISKKPLIATTNLTPEQLKNPEDVPHARIYGRLLEMCTPVHFTGGDFRKITAHQKMERLKKLMEGGESQ